MKIEHYFRSSSSRRSRVTLETDTERALSDSDLLLICDNHQGISFNKQTGSYDLTGESLGAPRHFGGHVERDGDRCRVTVWID